MRLIHLSMKDFFSFKKAEIPLANQGLVLIEGDNRDSNSADSNGAGKSSIFEAIAWCLFGKTVRGVRSEEVVRKGGGTTIVALSMKLGTSDVTITRKKGNNTSEKLEIMINDIPVQDTTLMDLRATQAKVIELISCDYVTFVNSIMFGKGVVKLFAACTDQEQKAILEQILSIDRFATARDKANLKIKELVLESKDHQNKLSSLRNNKQNLKESFDSVKAALDNLAEQVEEANGRREEKMDKLRKQIKDTSKEYKEAKRELDKMEQPAALDQAEKEANLNRVRKKLAKYEALLERERELLGVLENHAHGSNCEVCGGELDEKQRLKLIKEHKTTIDDYFRKVRGARDAVDEIGRIIKAEKFRHDSKNNDLTKGRQAKQRRLAELKARHTHLKEKLEDWKSEAAPTASTKTLRRQLRGLKERYADTKTSIAKVIGKLELLEAKASLYRFWEIGFGNQGIKSYLLDTITPILNERANELASILTERAFRIKFSTITPIKSGEVRDKFSITITDSRGQEFQYKSVSDGERRRLDLCILLALQYLAETRAGSRPNILLLDEVFDSLDQTGVEKAIQLIYGIARSKESVFVVTHNRDLKNYFHNVVTVVKKDSISTIKASKQRVDAA